MAAVLGRYERPTLEPILGEATLSIRPRLLRGPETRRKVWAGTFRSSGTWVVVDRVYKAGIPELRKRLEELQTKFSHLPSRTDWVDLRVAPLLRHAKALEQQLTSRRFSQEISRLTKGVVMFRSDLVYLRTNVLALGKILRSEEKARVRHRQRG